jgi:hypothetical protein
VASGETCANCGKTYVVHLDDTRCSIDSVAKWFPKSIADALERQRRRLRYAQKKLVNGRGRKEP